MPVFSLQGSFLTYKPFFSSDAKRHNRKKQKEPLQTLSTSKHWNSTFPQTKSYPCEGRRRGSPKTDSFPPLSGKESVHEQKGVRPTAESTPWIYSFNLLSNNHLYKRRISLYQFIPSPGISDVHRQDDTTAGLSYNENATHIQVIHATSWTTDKQRKKGCIQENPNTPFKSLPA